MTHFWRNSLDFFSTLPHSCDNATDFIEGGTALILFNYLLMFFSDAFFCDNFLHFFKNFSPFLFFRIFSCIWLWALSQSMLRICPTSLVKKLHFFLNSTEFRLTRYKGAGRLAPSWFGDMVIDREHFIVSEQHNHRSTIFMRFRNVFS